MCSHKYRRLTPSYQLWCLAKWIFYFYFVLFRFLFWGRRFDLGYRGKQVFKMKRCEDKFSYFSIELSIKSHDCKPRMISFGIIGHQTHNWEWKFYKAEITSSQTSFCTNFAIKLSFIPVFPFSWAPSPL